MYLLEKEIIKLNSFKNFLFKIWRENSCYCFYNRFAKFINKIKIIIVIMKLKIKTNTLILYCQIFYKRFGYKAKKIWCAQIGAKKYVELQKRLEKLKTSNSSKNDGKKFRKN